MAQLEKCDEDSCEDIACIIVHWPGKVPPPVYCVDHAAKAVGVLGHMGTPVNVEPYQPKWIGEPRTSAGSLD